MKITFSSHPLQRIRERKMSKLQILSTIKNPSEKTESYRNRMVYRKAYGLKTLEVVTKEESGGIIVISAYYLKEENYEN